MILVLQKKSKIQNALSFPKFKNIFSGRRDSCKKAYFINQNHKETTEKLNSMSSYFIKKQVQPCKENSLLLLISQFSN